MDTQNFEPGEDRGFPIVTPVWAARWFFGGICGPPDDMEIKAGKRDGHVLCARQNDGGRRCVRLGKKLLGAMNAIGVAP